MTAYGGGDGGGGRVCAAGTVGGGIFAYGESGGRGNLRENREDPAPTVGRLRGCHCVSHRDPGAINRNAVALIATRHATLVREGTRQKGEHSLRSASPLPRAQ